MWYNIAFQASFPYFERDHQIASNRWRNQFMRKIIVLEHFSLDGVIQAPGGREEDPSGGFKYGGWGGPYSDDIIGTALRRQMNLPFDLLVGRKTFDIWEAYWPKHADAWPAVNTATKYVASNTRTSSEWQPSVFLDGDVAEKVARIKQEPGPDLNVWGSGNLLQTLIKHDLVDVFWLMIYPITLGHGKRLFADGTIPAAFKVTESIVGAKGVILVNYERAGDVATADVDE
jgi:dihydrofolate reductase